MSITRLLTVLISISILSACGGGKSDDKPADPIPQSNAGVTQNVQELALVTLDGSGSVANNSNAITFNWSQVSGTTVSLSSASIEKPTFTAPELLADETLVFQLIVGNGVKNSLPSTVDINISADNDIPTANTSVNQSVVVATTVTLDGSASSDPENQTLTFAWTQTSGSAVALSDSAIAQPQFDAPSSVVLNETLTFQLVVNDGVNNSAASTVQIKVTSAPHSVVINKELMVTDLTIVEHPGHAQAAGHWTFEHLMNEMMPVASALTDAGKSDFVKTWLNHWLTTQTVNTFNVPARTAMQTQILDPWLTASALNGKAAGVLDLSIAPFRLLAIVNRMDLAKRDVSGNVVDAGESRFVFGVLSSGGFQTQFTVIFEYGLPATTEAELNSWINDWHNLSLHDFGTDPYEDALLALTDRFTSRNADPLKPNGSSLNQIRSNEIALAGPWELREFNISAGTGQLFQVTVKDNPDFSLKSSAVLAQLINDNETEVLTGKFVVPESISGQPILGGASINNLGLASALNPAGVNNPEARHKLSLNTCMGCHGGETGTVFLHVNPRNTGSETQLSSFMTGIGNAVIDPVDGVTARTFSELDDRKVKVEALLSDRI